MLSPLPLIDFFRAIIADEMEFPFFSYSPRLVLFQSPPKSLRELPSGIWLQQSWP